MTKKSNDLFIVEPEAQDIIIKEEKDIIRREELMPLFDTVGNPNHDIFVVPTQEGVDKDDQWNGSIGDATMEHISHMRHKLLELENFVHMPNGNIFRIEQNVAPPDELGVRSTRNQILKVMTTPTTSSKKKKFTTEDKEKVIEFLQSEIEAQKQAREERNDAMEQVLVPYEEWENAPQMSGVIDIPSTPAPLYIYAGNSSQMFYDWIPEDHPDLKKLNGFLSMMNSIDWDHFTNKTVEYFKNWLFGQEWTHYFAAERLHKLCIDIERSNSISPATLAEEALHDIDLDWMRQLKVQVIDKFYAEDPIIQELKEFENTLKANKKTGKLSWADIGKMGQVLYKKYGSTMNTTHWSFYKELKRKYCPEVRLGHIDINKANMNDLRKFFTTRFRTDLDSILSDNLTDEQADKKYTQINKQIEKLASWVYFNRPFMTLEDLVDRDILTVHDIGYTNKTVSFIGLVKKAYKESLSFKTSAPLNQLAQQIVAFQKNKPDMFSEQDWYSIWQSYRIAKKLANKSLGLNL